MPKESVYGDPNDRFALDVGWNRDMNVSVGIRTVDGRHLVDEFYGQEPVLEKIGAAAIEWAQAFAAANLEADDPEAKRALAIETGRHVLDIVTGSDYGMESLWWNPGRAQVNRLIRLLRKARDAAFGSDA